MSKNMVKVHVFGLRNYDLDKLLIYLHLDWWVHDSNMHISFLFCHFRKLHSHGLLRPNLIITLDNCWKDNKNRWLFAFFGLLVANKWVLTVLIMYLMSRHSHNMVDYECFQPLEWQNRSKNDYCTLEEMIKFIHLMFKRRPIKAEIPDDMCVWNWFDMLNLCLTKIKYHSFQRSFLISEVNGVLCLQYKSSVLSRAWKGEKTLVFQFHSLEVYQRVGLISSNRYHCL